jgi:hypothetical protein
VSKCLISRHCIALEGNEKKRGGGVDAIGALQSRSLPRPTFEAAELNYARAEQLQKMNF